MTAKNPTGHPLSGPTKNGARTYRPRVGKRRPRMRVPADVAEKLEDDAARTTDHRRQAARAAAEDRKAKRAAAKHPPKSKASKASGPRKAPKKRAKKMATRKATGGAPPVAKVQRALGVSKTAAADIVACSTERKKKRAKRAPKQEETTQGDLFAKVNPCRAPVNLRKLQIASFLGEVKELAWDNTQGYRQRFHPAKGKRIQLLWSPGAKAAFFITQKTRRQAAGDVPDAAARQVVQRWTGKPAGEAHTLVAPGLLNGRQAWKKIGVGHSITYWSDKAGPREPHEHDLDKVGVYKLGNLWVICGGKLRITSRGLEG